MRKRQAACRSATLWKRESFKLANRNTSTMVKQSLFKARKGYWGLAINQRTFLDGVARDLGIKEFSDWYGVTRKEIIQRGGGSLFTYYSSLGKALQQNYPEYNWDLLRFAPPNLVPRGHWQDENNLIQALNAAEAKLGINQPEDWYTVAMTDLREVGFPFFIGKLKLVQLLVQKYPNYKWEKVLLLKGRFAQQKRLEKSVSSLFPDVEIKWNARKEANIINPETDHYLELDVYLPSLKLAFEYQDKHHYMGAHYSHTPLADIQARDANKRKLVEQHGITLVTVPCWWDGRQESLASTVKEIRSDLLTDVTVAESVKPIPKEVPPNFFDRNTFYVEDVGIPSTATFMTTTSVDPAGWWLFEKYDGVRGFWNPKKKSFFSRLGNRFNLPQEIVDSMPSMFLDGEIWFGRDNFQETMKLSNRVDKSLVDWSKFKYMVFDIPNEKGTYADRYSKLESFFAANANPYVGVAPRTECKSVEHLEQLFQDIVDKGGEGVILRNPSAPYEPGRSTNYLKHKKFRDAEARIIGSEGPHHWLCELPNGITFTAAPGTSEFVKRCNPKPGDIVSFKHHGYLLATRRPKIPTLYRLRSDLTWEDVVNNWKDPKPKVSAWPVRKIKKETKPKGFWRSPENKRKFFTELAEERGFGPLVPENWTKVTRNQVLAKKGGASLLKGYKSFWKPLQSAFPELNLQETKVSVKWKDISLCREFFDEYAKERRFDPLDPENWYSFTLSRMCLKKGGNSIRYFHGGFMNALQKAYPEVAFVRWIQYTEPKKGAPAWSDTQRCREFFDEFAREQGFDPLQPENWYSLNMAKLHDRKGASAIQGHNGGFRLALQNAYPEVNFTKWQNSK